ncbi:hypothetical protein PF005_g2293 [Phytophthora fragariae]|uniref:Uncharacterized protein n=2 Tax=Phytophthora TaxID=4783 RepID=A0A6A4EWQ5_9STRA|nr:hypothetical protein PF003_g32243 [Phytophthora fragariae]KAE9006738.1 hypothetical protein PR002_g16408 [Phytophthora rubi]KAE8947925.1 hypothetical protein PF009_g2487 [Phytophthora fragariae]KAE9010772.1 hypothetical protein PR001_g16076 [Phytophthora rubi]KAE9029456.1 hypothetical protein PF011_g1058 [Phytophthora fragariae]
MAGRPRQAPQVGDLLLPSLRNPARCGDSNQREADAGVQWDDNRHRRARRRRPREPQLPVAYVVLPPVFPIDKRRHRRHHSDRRRAIKTRHSPTYSSSSDEQRSSSSDDEDSNGEEDSRIVRPPRATTMRSQRMRSIAAMSKLQHDAASTIQREYRFYRRRLAGRHRRNQRLARQAQDLLDVFLLQEVTNIVPTCLLDVLRETCMQEAATAKHRKDLAASLGDGVLLSLIDGCIRDVFDDVLQAMVKSYFAQQIDLSRAATPPALAVAADILDDWTQDLVADLLPEVLTELASEYTAQQQHEAPHSAGSNAIDASTLDSVTTLVAPATNQVKE